MKVFTLILKLAASAAAMCVFAAGSAVAQTTAKPNSGAKSQSIIIVDVIIQRAKKATDFVVTEDLIIFRKKGAPGFIITEDHIVI